MDGIDEQPARKSGNASNIGRARKRTVIRYTPFLQISANRGGLTDKSAAYLFLEIVVKRQFEYFLSEKVQREPGNGIRPDGARHRNRRANGG
jgi:hypothetical protein